MIPRTWLMLVGVPAVAVALFTFTIAVNGTRTTLGGETTPTVSAGTPTTTTGGGTPTTTAAATITPAAAGTSAAGTTTPAAGLPSTGIADEGPNASVNLLWVLGLALAAVTIGGMLLLSAKRR